MFARKYRPQTFAEVVGQDHITRTLQNAVNSKRLAQAYLFVGPRGIGKTSTARILAKALNCQEGTSAEPCGKCDACLEIAEGRSLDVIEIDGASQSDPILVKEDGTVLYTLAGVVHPEQGWGRADETFGFMTEARRQGAPDWFALGDRDLVVHVERTRRLAEGERLSVITAEFAERFGVASRLLPMSDTPVATLLDTDAGRLEFQHYFVRLRCEPAVRAVHFADVETGIETALRRFAP